MATDQSPREDWHAAEAGAVVERLETHRDGLSRDAVAERLERHGPNRLRPQRRHGPLMRFLLQFHNVLIYVLVAAAVVTALLGHWVDTGVILGVVVINAVIGVLQEGKAERALDAIRDMLSPQATAIRDGRRVTVPAEELVPGDIVVLQSGDKVPADLRLLRVRELRVDEAVLTGESVAVDKHADPVPADAVLGDRLNMAFSGTLVAYGQATGVVTATGDHTEIGRISSMLADVEKLTTPLLREIAVFGRWLAGAILVAAALTFLFGLVFRDYAWGEIFLAAVGLAVAAIPEGLPAIMTITLAIGVQRMAGRNAIIRKLPAVETLGSVTVICSDKTGTLTRNEMTVQAVATAEADYAVSGVGYAPEGAMERDGVPVDPEAEAILPELLRAALLCNDAVVQRREGDWHMEGDPTEGALMTLALKGGLDASDLRAELPRTDAIPFESEHRFMASLHHDHHGAGVIYLKGAPERVLEMCTRQRTADGDQAIDPDHWRGVMDGLADRGQRVAMTGDGVNDAPALKRADVGVAMGLKGTEVSKEASDMVLADDNFASIARAVEEGRTVYDNLRKALLFLLPTNGGQALVVIAAVLAGLLLPISPVQILWVNMVTAVTLGLALAFEPTEPGVMARPPRAPTEPILSGFLVWRVAFVSVLLVIATFGLFLLAHTDDAAMECARTVAVNTLVVCQIFYLVSARFVRRPALAAGLMRGNPWVPGSIAAIVVLQLLFTYAPPLQLLFGSQALAPADWLRILAAGLTVFLLVELEKWLLTPGRGKQVTEMASTTR